MTRVMIKKAIRIKTLAPTSKDSLLGSQMKMRTKERTKTRVKLTTPIVFLLIQPTVKYEKIYETADADPITTPLRNMLNWKSANISVGA